MAKKIDPRSMGEKGGKARAKRLSPQERSQIARNAALARWGEPDDIKRATHDGVVPVGDARIPCAVLEDGTRVLTQYGFLQAVGRSGRPQGRSGEEGFEKQAPFLAPNNLKTFVSKDLASSSRPIAFRMTTGGTAWGYRAELLPKVCEVYLRARDEGVLLKSQEKFAMACDILMRGLAHTGIVALVDEATGFQADRARDALAKILERFIADELRKWVKTFPDDFYKEMFRLKGWTYDPYSVKRPQLVGKYTNDLVYQRLAPGVLEELQRRNPKDEKGHRRNKHFQLLTEDVGDPRLREHLASVVALMRAASKWDEFRKMIDRALPKYKEAPLFSRPEAEDS
ncbi:MAG: P63C domain-containing protein [Planctomycetota bacterium]